MNHIKKYILTIIIYCIILPTGIYAEDAVNGDKLVSYDIVNNKICTVFTKAEIDINLNPDAETLKNYTYNWVDLGIFKMPASGDEWDTVFIKRIETNDLGIKVDDFGNISVYDYQSVYAIGYRPLYKANGEQSNPLIEMDWKLVEASYFKKVEALSAKITKFTDRITGVNKWMNDEEAKIYNWYFPDSEVVSKLVITPDTGGLVDSCIITMDANNTAQVNNKIEISDLRIVKIDVGGVEKLGTKDTPITSGTDTITYAVNLSDGEKDKEIAVYYKYRFKKKPAYKDVKITGSDLKLSNIVKVKPKIFGVEQTEIQAVNEIQIRDVKIDYR